MFLRQRPSAGLISIHAPVKGATSCTDKDPIAGIISIHAPVKGATPPASPMGAGRSNFNPRSREGSDPSPIRATSAAPISIHAPVKGATGDRFVLGKPSEFQSTLP